VKQWNTSKCSYGQECPLAHAGPPADPSQDGEGAIQQDWVKSFSEEHRPTEEVASTLQQMEVASGLEEGARVPNSPQAEAKAMPQKRESVPKFGLPTNQPPPNAAQQKQAEAKARLQKSAAEFQAQKAAESAVEPAAQLQATLIPLAQLQAALMMEADATAEELAVETQALAAEAEAFAAQTLAAKAQAAAAEEPTEPTQPNLSQARSAVEPKQAQDLEANIQAKSQPASKPSEEGKNPPNMSEQERAWHDGALTVGSELWGRFSEKEVLDRQTAAPCTPLCALDIVQSPRLPTPPSPPEWPGSPVSSSTKTSEAGQTL